MNIKAIATVLNVLIPAIQTAEKYFRGSGRGEEKKEAVLTNVVEEIRETDAELRKSGAALAFLSIITDPMAREKLGTLINAVVDFLNYVKLVENRPKLIN